MENFVCAIPTEIYFGKGQIQNLPRLLRRYGKNVLLGYGGGSIKKTGLYDTICTMLEKEGFHVWEVSGIEPNPRIETMEKGVEICRSKSIDVVLAVGGGSTIDCCKAIAAGTYYKQENSELWDLVMHGERITKTLPVISIVTLAATGSEMNGTAVISNMEKSIKKGMKNPLLCPVASICDPTYTFSVPKRQTAAGAIDTFCHVCEVYFQNPDDSKISDGLCEVLMRTVIQETPIALKDPTNYSARANLMWASTVGINGYAKFGKEDNPWSCHPIEHELSAYYDIIHGEGLAILMPHWMRYVLSDQTKSRFARYARNVWGVTEEDDVKAAQLGIEKTAAFFKECEAPTTLKEVGIDEQKLEDMAKDAILYGSFSKTYVPLKEKDILAILQASL